MHFYAIKLKKLLEKGSNEEISTGRYSFRLGKSRRIKLTYCLSDGVLYINKISIIKSSRKRYGESGKLQCGSSKQMVEVESQTEMQRKESSPNSYKTRFRLKKSRTKQHGEENQFLREQLRIQSCIIAQLTDALRATHEKANVAGKGRIFNLGRSSANASRRESKKKSTKGTFWRRLLRRKK